MKASRRPIIAIDGPAGSGKSTVAKLLAERLNYQYIDTGAMYRAVTLKAVRAGVTLDDQQAVEAVARAARIEFEPGRVGCIRLDGEDVSAAIRTPEVSRLVSAYVASYPGVRQAMVSLQRELGRNGAVVMEGRDITTVVFPDAEIKIYLHASQEIRARRRYEELKSKGLEQPYAELLADLRRRDQEDRTRPGGSLQCAPEALVVDSTEPNAGQVTEIILRAVQARDNQPASPGQGTLARERPQAGLPGDESETPAAGMSPRPEKLFKPSWGRLRQPPTMQKTHGRKRLPRACPGGFMNWFCYWSGHFLMGIVFRLFHRWRVLGGERIPAAGGMILASNHASYLDPPLLGTAIPHRPLFFVARDTLFRNPVFGQIIRWCNAVPIDRGKGGRQNWDAYVRLLDRGKALLIFPEGTRTETGDLQAGKAGFGKIVYLSRKPVYPAYVQGTYQAFPKGGKYRHHPITVIFGPPVPLDDLLAQPEDNRVYKEISRRTMEAIAKLKTELGELERTPPSPLFKKRGGTGAA